MVLRLSDKSLYEKRCEKPKNRPTNRGKSKHILFSGYINKGPFPRVVVSKLFKAINCIALYSVRMMLKSDTIGSNNAQSINFINFEPQKAFKKEKF